ncbi:MAG: hypothetical protein AVDCRST_MAG73-2299, partial [uncultured Thermomicrobiales bacterium]
ASARPTIRPTSPLPRRAPRLRRTRLRQRRLHGAAAGSQRRARSGSGAARRRAVGAVLRRHRRPADRRPLRRSDRPAPALGFREQRRRPDAARLEFGRGLRRPARRAVRRRVVLRCREPVRQRARRRPRAAPWDPVDDRPPRRVQRRRGGRRDVDGRGVGRRRWVPHGLRRCRRHHARSGRCRRPVADPAARGRGAGHERRRDPGRVARAAAPAGRATGRRPGGGRALRRRGAGEFQFDLPARSARERPAVGRVGHRGRPPGDAGWPADRVGRVAPLWRAAGCCRGRGRGGGRGGGRARHASHRGRHRRPVAGWVLPLAGGADRVLAGGPGRAGAGRGGGLVGHGRRARLVGRRPVADRPVGVVVVVAPGADARGRHLARHRGDRAAAPGGRRNGTRPTRL